MAGLQPPITPTSMQTEGEYSPRPALLESRRLRVPLLTLHPGTLSPRWLVAREWGRRPFPVTSDAEFFPIWKVIRSMQSLCTWPCAGGSAGHWCAAAAQVALFTSNYWCRPPSHIGTDGCPRAAGTFSSLHITYSNTDCRAVASKQPVRLLKRLQDSGKNKRGHSIGSALVSTAAQLINLTQSEEDRRRDLAPCLKTQNVDFKSVCFCY